MDVVEFLEKKVQVPAEWNHFSREQVALISRELCRPHLLSAFRATIMASVLGLQGHLWKFAGKVYYYPTRWRIRAFRKIAAGKAWLVDPEDFFRVGELLNWMFEVVEGEQDLRLAERRVNLTTNHWPVIRTGWRRMYGPSSELTNATTDEYVKAEVEYEQFISTQKEEHLNKLCAALYRPRKRFFRLKRFLQITDADPRQPYSGEMPDHHPIWQRVPVWQRFAILLFFEGVRNQFITTFDLLYQPSEPGDESDDDGPTGWPAIIRVMAGHVIRIEQVAKVPIYNFLFDLNERIRDARKLKAMNKKR